jgi:hypothetical protein
MVVRNKLYKIFDKYRELLKTRYEKSNHHERILKGNRTKNKILDFYIANNHWPSRLSTNKVERALGTAFENLVSKKSRAFDRQLRRIIMMTGRTTNNKRPHDIQGSKKQILEFIKTHGHTPKSYDCQTIEGEGNLRSKLDRYTLTLGDMSFLGQVYGYDKCHRSGIPSKFRSIINEALNTEKPLIRMV